MELRTSLQKTQDAFEKHASKCNLTNSATAYVVKNGHCIPVTLGATMQHSAEETGQSERFWPKPRYIYATVRRTRRYVQ